jgi:peptidoglycan/LPS O-acetylase OafA/YrhL
MSSIREAITSSTMNKGGLTIPSLTSFRFITAFVVFLFHCSIHLDWTLGVSILDRFLKHGAVFMTGFFVLSGYIMAHVYANTDFSKIANIRLYYLKRFAKIYPTYALSTLAYFAFFRDFTPSEHARILVNDLFLVQAFFPSMFHLGINGGTWSLTVEMFLYLLFPLLMLLCGKSPRIAIAGIIIAALVSFNASLERTDPIYANPVFRLADFICGIGFYFGFARISRRRLAHVLTVLLLFAACVYLGSSKYRYMRGHFAFVPLFALWISLAHHSKSAFYNNKPLEYLGLISYSFYLWQFAAIELGKRMIVWLPTLELHLIVLIVFAVNVAISALSYHFVEERSRKWILRRFGSREPSVSTHAHTPPETDSSHPALTAGIPCNPDIESLSNLPVHRKQSRD